MKIRSFLMVLLIIVLLSAPVRGEEVDINFIQNLIKNDKIDQAREILEEKNIKGRPDLQYYQALLWSWNEEYSKAVDLLSSLVNKYPQRIDFYEHLARVYGWMGNYDKASVIIKKAQKIKNTPQLKALQAQNQEWQENWFRASRLRKEALKMVGGTELEDEYKRLWQKAKAKTTSSPFIEFSYVYEEKGKADLILGGDFPLQDGINLQLGGGLDFDNDDLGVKASSNIIIEKPLLSDNLTSETIINIDPTTRSFSNIFTYKYNSKNKLKLNLKLVKEENFQNEVQYGIIQPQYIKKFDKMTLVFKTAARKDKKGWIPDFSQHLTFYYPVDQYQFNLEAGYYKGGDYTLRLGLDMSSIFSRKSWEIKEFSSWVNNKETGKLKLRFEPVD